MKHTRLIIGLTILCAGTTLGGGAARAAGSPIDNLPPAPIPTPFPYGTTLLPEDSLSAFSLQGTASRAEKVETVPVEGQKFNQALRVRHHKQPAKPGDLRLVAANTTPVEQGDVVLATFSVRGTPLRNSAAGKARAMFIFEQGGGASAARAIGTAVDVGPTWKQIYVPFETTADSVAREATIAFHLGFTPQEVEIGGISVINFRKKVQVKDLPGGATGERQVRSQGVSRSQAVKGYMQIAGGAAVTQTKPNAVSQEKVSQGKDAARGPLLMDAELFEALDLESKGMEAVKAAVQGGNLTLAKSALAAYLRRRTSVPWSFDPHKIDRTIPYRKVAADDAVAGKVQVVTIRHTFPNGDIDWFYNATVANPDLPDNSEWQWQLNRMGFWGDLGRGYWARGDETYAKAWVKQLRSWVQSAPRPQKGANQNAGSAWRTIEAGIRMAGSWPEAYHRFLLSPSFGDEDIVLFLKSCLEQARYLRAHSTTGNWLTMEMSGLYTVGALFPELKEAKEWRAYAAGRLYDELNKQFLPDGAQVELTPGYHNVALENTLAIPTRAKLMGYLEELPAGYIAGMEKAFNFNLRLMTPDRNMPAFNDSWPVNVVRDLEKAVPLFPNRHDFAWVASEGKAGAPPQETSHPFPYAGYFVMRSGWERDANYLVLDAGPLGYGHVHQDKLNVVLWAYGRELLFDGGGGSYEKSKWRSYATDTFAHNTVLVDGQPQRRQTRDREANVSRTPLDARWQSTPAYDFAAGVYEDGYGKEDNRPVAHTRRVLFVKPDLFIVADTLAPKDNAAHTYQARWHLLPPATTTDAATSTVATTDEGKANLAIVPLLKEGLEVRSASAQTEPELLGWHVRKDMDPQYVPATTVLHTRQGEGVQHFLTLLVPLKPGAANPVRQVQAKGPAEAEVTFTDGRRLVVQAGADAAGGISVSETLADGQPGRVVSGGVGR